MGATPPEELQRQHEEACQNIQDILPLERIDHGEIPLAQKQRPTETVRPSPEDDNLICTSSRGTADIKALQDLIREGYNNHCLPDQISKSDPSYSPTNLWDTKNASLHNVSVVRASHDAWGIKKIVLIFCDDFISRIFELPWWHSRPDIRKVIEPVLEVLGIDMNVCDSGDERKSHSKKQLVRLLLASLPPGVTIPIHHDTGEWVRQTHRVHVPILVSQPERIMFRCGPTSSQMQRIDCQEGHVFEMNNQAKHAVSNCSDDYRVHLILDYINTEEGVHDFNNREYISLQPGERLLQTRRSIDRCVDWNTRPSPTFFILGAQKAGTTSLYEYMVQHPLIVRAKRRETHCLDWRWLSASNIKKYNSTKKQSKTLPEDALFKQQRQHCLEFYYAKELQDYPSCLTGDSTPSYLLDTIRVIPRLKRVFPHFSDIKFFVMLRDPVARAFSHYQMVTSTKGTAAQLKTRGNEWRHLKFEQVVLKELQELQQRFGLIPYWKKKSKIVDYEGDLIDEKTSGGTANYDDYYVDEAVFDSFRGSPEEQTSWIRFQKEIPLSTGSHSLLARGLYDLQLRSWFRHFERDQFLICSLEDEMNFPGPLMEKVWGHLNLPPYPIEDTTPKNSREYSSPIEPDIRSLLKRFYAPHNDKLEDLLNREFPLWKI